MQTKQEPRYVTQDEPESEPDLCADCQEPTNGLTYCESCWRCRTDDAVSDDLPFDPDALPYEDDAYEGGR